ncbi:Uncharacterised protein [Cedecea neteri]|uniref:N-acetyltransferase domain-containing protein n=1 Tax=Cedecea neteri TaxID=158822 RepID=A0A2X3JBQ0_9ENTR|nr:Uncharacterised protein [Cedecea neteri]
MTVRRATLSEAQALWTIRNEAIRFGCRETYPEDVLAAWTPDEMPEGYRNEIINNPFFVADNESGEPVATGFLDLKNGSVEAIFTLPGLDRPGAGQTDPSGYQAGSQIQRDEQADAFFHA